jgi:Ca2+-binding RTX toxin-like protein
VAGAIVTAIGAASPAVDVTASSTVSNIVALVAKSAGARGSFAVSLNSGGFDITSDIGAAAPGYNDGKSGEGDSVAADIEMVIGGTGKDTIDASHAGNISHILYGMDGDDTLTCAGSTVANTLYGGKGNDHLLGGSAKDHLYGGDGDDYVAGGPNDDTIDGDGANCVVDPAGRYAVLACTDVTALASTTAGSNFLDYAERTAPVVVNLTHMDAAAVGAQIGVSGEKDSVTNCSNIRGGSGSDTLTGDANANTIYGGPGDDTIRGGAGNDVIYGEGGDDTIYGEGGNDYLYGGTGCNKLYGDDPLVTSLIGVNMLDNSLGRLGAVDCGPSEMNILFSDGEETGTNTCKIK